MERWRDRKIDTRSTFAWSDLEEAESTYRLNLPTFVCGLHFEVLIIPYPCERWGVAVRKTLLMPPQMPDSSCKVRQRMCLGEGWSLASDDPRVAKENQVLTGQCSSIFHSYVATCQSTSIPGQHIGGIIIASSTNEGLYNRGTDHAHWQWPFNSRQGDHQTR